MTRRILALTTILTSLTLLLIAGAACASADPGAVGDSATGARTAVAFGPLHKPLRGLVLTGADIVRIRAAIAAGTKPTSAAYSAFMSGRVPRLMSGRPHVYKGPYTGIDLDTQRQVFGMHWTDGSNARDLAIAYAISGRTRYASASRRYLIAWAKGSTPTRWSDSPMPDTGQLQSYGFFSFAYAYDLTYRSGVYSLADRRAIKAYLRAGTAALQSCDRFDAQRAETAVPEALDERYEWTPNLRYSRYDDYIGGDFAVLVQAASLACARVTDNGVVVRRILYDRSFLFNLNHMLAHGLTPANQGDGVAGHPSPVPAIYIYANPVAGRGSGMDYMTYNVRVLHVLVDMAQHSGWTPSKVVAARAKLRSSWAYLGRFFGPGAEPLANPNDTINYGACLPRFALAYRTFGDQHYRDILLSRASSGYYEPQLLGPVSLTHTAR
jgi:hypothetical protein